MHANGHLIEQLYTSLDRHIPGAMADCYDNAATFHDIAFDLRGKSEIAGMWEMTCSSDIRVKFEVVNADEETAVAKVVDEYTFSETGRRVRNVIESRFRFRDGLIIEQIDSCDPRKWAAMALGGILGFLAGHFRFLRSWKARSLLRHYQRAPRRP